MKKLLSSLLVAALLLAVLAGCQGIVTPPAPQAGADQTAPAPQESVPPATTQPVEVTPTDPVIKYITPEEAKAIALQDAGLQEADVRDLEVDLDLDDGKAHYDVDFEKGSADYDYDIDAVTGELLRVEKPTQKPATETTQKPAADTPASTQTTEKKQLTKTEARDIALKHAGLKATEVRDLETELDRDDGKLHYDVDFEKDGYDYDYEIDAYSGKILKSRKERD